ncbi:hypothetical protein F3Y22_tig00000340pilonHSYRG00173 [Hibiscus syriacus]|uniref:Uncharacterized protein n=1 Tax=Hibiscus syriacus TaxID=106335 RepID=A0A6A3D0Q3_HIBSY|nr:hypothetical protein F3Y22_tig00000340pilonHSYRG00173 [Hibiscus syriacus]
MSNIGKVNWAYASSQREDTSGMQGSCGIKKTGRSRGFGFVSFRDQQVHWSLHWAAKGATPNDEKLNSDAKSVVEPTNRTSDDPHPFWCGVVGTSVFAGQASRFAIIMVGTSSTVVSAADLAAYERQMAMSKYSGAQLMSMMHPQGQHTLKQAAMGMGAAAAGQAIYDGGYQHVATTQQLMYYQ